MPRPIKLAVFDLDGVFTDGKIYINSDGKHMKNYNCKDTASLKFLRKAGVQTAMITAHQSEVLPHMIHLYPRMDHLVSGVYDKITQLEKWREDFGLSWEEISYIGDDLPDLAPMKQVGFSGCPSDAAPELLAIADYVCQNRGGNGAVREFVEHLLARNSRLEQKKEIENLITKDGLITAVIPVRAGSQRVKKKNLRPFAGSSLLALKIQQLKEVEGIDRIVVSSDSLEMLQLATDLGVETHQRDPYYASSECPNYLFWEHLAKEVVSTEYFMLANCVAPLIKTESYNQMIREFKEAIRNGDEFDSLASVETAKDFIWDMDKRTAINYDASKAPNSQDLPNLVKLTFGVCLLPRAQVLRNQNVIGEKPILYQLDQIEAMDIDTEADFKVAEILYLNR